MNALTKIEDQKTLPGMPEPAAPSMFELIMRAVKDPACDPAKMAQLLELSREVRKDDAKAAFTRAMIEMKPKLPVIERNGRITIHEKGKEKVKANEIQSTPYALYEDIDEAITPILTEHGFVLTYRTGNLPDGRVTITGILSHEMGHSEESEMALPLDTSGSKNNVQAAGSSTKYGMRYTATALLNIRTKGQDDDGKAGGDPPTIAPDSLRTLQDLIDAYAEHGANAAGVCKFFKVEALPELTTAQYRKAVEMLNTKYAGKKKVAP